MGSTLTSKNVLFVLAGFYQIRSGTSKIEYFYSNSDDPRDQWAIGLGSYIWDYEGKK